MRDLAGLLATVGMAGALVGGATVGAPAEASELDADAWLAGLDAQLDALASSAPDRGWRAGPVATWIETRGHRPDLVPRLSRAMAVTAAFRDLPQKAQRDERVQARMWEEAPEIAASVFEMSDLLAGLSEAEREEIGRALDADPRMLDDLDAQIDGVARRRRVSEGRRRQLRGYTRTIGWRLRRQRPTLVIDETLQRMEKVCRKFGFARADWRTASTSGIGALRPSGREGHALSTEDPVARAAFVTLGIGGGMIGTGVLLIAVGAASASMGLTVVGFLLGLLGLLVVGVACVLLIIASQRNNYRPAPPEEDEEDEDGEPSD